MEPRRHPRGQILSIQRGLLRPLRPWLLAAILAITHLTCQAQAKPDTLAMILSSRIFLLEEEYTGDWGGHVKVFTFTNLDTAYSVQWIESGAGSSGTAYLAFLSDVEMEPLKQAFLECPNRIVASEAGSTEHILYKFTSAGMAHVLDDGFTMACYEPFRKWQGMIRQRALR